MITGEAPIYSVDLHLGLTVLYVEKSHSVVMWERLCKLSQDKLVIFSPLCKEIWLTKR